MDYLSKQKMRQRYEKKARERHAKYLMLKRNGQWWKYSLQRDINSGRIQIVNKPIPKPTIWQKIIRLIKNVLHGRTKKSDRSNTIKVIDKK